MGLISSRHAPWLLDAECLLAAQTTDSHRHLHSTQRVYFCSGSAKPNVPLYCGSSPAAATTTRSVVLPIHAGLSQLTSKSFTSCCAHQYPSIHPSRSVRATDKHSKTSSDHLGRSVSIVTSCYISYRLSLTLIFYNASVRNIQPTLLLT